MKKLLGLATIPAPYRVDVLCGLREKYQVDVYFEQLLDQNRNARYCGEGEGYTVLNTAEHRKEYEKQCKNIRQYDLVLAHDYTSKMGMQLMLRCIRHHVPYAINVDGAFIYPNRIKDAVKRFFIKRAAVYFASGNSAKEYLIHYGAKEENIYYHRFTATHREDMPRSCPDDEERARMKEILGLPPKKTVLSVGQFIERKGFDVLLHAWKGMPEDCQLLIIGGGEQQKNYETMIREEQIHNVMLLDFVDKEKIWDYYRAAEVFVLPTREDIWGLVINEAMASGLPVITTDMCIAGRELIEEEKQGYIVPVNDVQALHDKMLDILTQEAKRKEMGQRNFEKIQDYVVENIVADHLEVLKKVLGE
jgi:glycosyltransferase involved in cell wall biosynthesis